MARMIEALRQAEQQRPQPTPAAAPTPAESEAVRDESAADEMPYIEVGGKDKAVQASPDVLACPAGPRPAVAAAPRLAPVPAAAAPLAVAFQPFAGLRPTGRALVPELLAFHQPDHPASRQYQTLLHQLLGSEKVLLFTAASPGVGATTILLNLALCCARGRRQVAVVDLNLARPAVADRLGLLPTPGLPEVLTGAVAVEHAFQPTAQEGLAALTAGPGLSGLLTAEAVRWLVNCVRDRFDAVFIDGPTWEDTAALAALVPTCDAVYPVLPEADSDGPAVHKMLQAITRRGGRLRGLLHAQRAA
jgi:Mrp family chromosome partitioning ATPase